MKFRGKIMLSMVALMALLFGIGGSILISISFSSALHREQEAAAASYEMITNTLQLLNDINSWEDGNDVSDSLDEVMDVGGVSWEGRRLSGDGCVYSLTGVRQEEFLDLSGSTDESHYAIGFTENGNGRQLMQISGTLAIGEEALRLDLLRDISSVYETRAEQNRVFYRIYAVILVLCLLLSYIVARVLTANLSKLSCAAREFARGNLSFRSHIDTPDEIGSLARDFDDMAERLETSIAELKDAMKRQEEFMGSFSHELKTPMTSVIGYADLIRRQALSEEECAEAANYIFSEGKRLENLSQKLLSVCLLKKEPIVMKPCSPKEIISTLLEHLRPIYREEGISLSSDCEAGDCRMEPDLMQTVLVNLLDNARKAIQGGEEDAPGKCAGHITLQSRMTADGCVISCTDNGCGIPEESLKHLTEAFYRVDKSRSRALGGAGLGLTLCQKIAALHGGELSAQSDPKKGTTITVTIRSGR